MPGLKQWQKGESPKSVILSDKLGNQKSVDFHNVKAVCFECAEWQMNILREKMSNNPLVKLLELKIEVVWEE